MRSVVALLEPRDAFFDGRTNACNLFEDMTNSGHQILYYDVCSLYPWVMKYCDYPVAHPEVILENFKAVSEYYGLSKMQSSVTKASVSSLSPSIY